MGFRAGVDILEKRDLLTLPEFGEQMMQFIVYSLDCPTTCHQPFCAFYHIDET
jgi:hypothetical protein